MSFCFRPVTLWKKKECNNYKIGLQGNNSHILGLYENATLFKEYLFSTVQVVILLYDILLCPIPSSYQVSLKYFKWFRLT